MRAYTRNAAYLNVSSRMKKWPGQKETSNETIDTKSDVKPIKSFTSKDFPKSFSVNRDVRMARNIIKEVTEKLRAISDAKENTWKAN